MSTEYVEALAAKYSEITEIWLFGSRANNRAKADSDWDYFVFGTNELLEKLKGDTEFRAPEIDLFVVCDGDHFEKPWGEPKKDGKLSEWKWKKLDNCNAEYWGTKPQVSGFGVAGSKLSAQRVK